MKCPNCGARRTVEVNLHSEGFVSPETPAKECGTCRVIWTARDGEVDLIHMPGPIVSCAAAAA